MGVKLINRKIEIFALPMNSTYILLEPKYRTKICEMVKTDNFRFFRSNNFDKPYLYRLKNNKQCSLKFLFSLFNYFNLDINEINRNIIRVTSGKNNSVGIGRPKVPFDLDNKYGGIFLGSIMGDGARNRLGGIVYNNKSSKLIKILLNSVKKIFGQAHYKIQNKRDGTIQLYFPKIVGDVAGLFGIKRGYKTISDCYIPLENFSNEFKVNFIRQIFDDEGNVRKTDRRLQIKQTRNIFVNKSRIRSDIVKYAPKVLLEIKKTLFEFNIISKISLEGIRIKKGVSKGDFSLNIYGKENLIKFKNLIGFKLEYKNDLLKEVIMSYTYPSAARNQRLLFALQHAAKIELTYGCFDKFLMREQTKRALWRTCTYFLIDLKKKNFIKVIEKPRKEKGHPLCWKYRLTKKGWNYLKENKDKIFLDDIKKITSPAVFQ